MKKKRPEIMRVLEHVSSFETHRRNQIIKKHYLTQSI